MCPTNSRSTHLARFPKSRGRNHECSCAFRLGQPRLFCELRRSIVGWKRWQLHYNHRYDVRIRDLRVLQLVWGIIFFRAYLIFFLVEVKKTPHALKLNDSCIFDLLRSSYYYYYIIKRHQELYILHL